MSCLAPNSADGDHQALLVDVKIEEPGPTVWGVLAENAPDLMGVNFGPANQQQETAAPGAEERGSEDAIGDAIENALDDRSRRFRVESLLEPPGDVD